MKIGILIAAHSNQEQLIRLVNVLKKDFEIFIHIDKKSSIPVNLFKREDNIHTIKSHEVYWGSFNQVRATLSLLELAYQQGCDYYIFISGIDVPIKTNQEIIDEIRDNPQAIYMDYAALPRKDWNHRGGLDRIQLFYENLKNRDKFTPYNLSWIIFRRFQKYLNLRRKLLEINYYGGINWINFSKEIVEYILEYIKNNPRYIKKFEYSLCGDEIFFQTLIMNSKYYDKVHNNSKRYIEYDSGGPENPRILRTKDFDKIMTSDAWFARKFNDNIDKNIIDKIYLNLNR